MPVSICVTFEYLIHVPWLAPWNVYFQQLNPLNVYIPQFNHGMYTFHSLPIECIHSMVLAIEYIHSTVIYIQCNIYVYNIEFSRLHNLHHWYWNSLLYSLISSSKTSAFVHFGLAIANHCNLAFSFHQVLITAGWTNTAWYVRLAQHLHTWLVGWLEYWSPIQLLTRLGVV